MEQKNKQIEEMARIISANCCIFKNCEECKFEGTSTDVIECFDLYSASRIYNAGYRKQSEGEWVDIDICAEDMYCSVCGGIAPVDCEKEDFYKSNFCPNCGAKMKGGTE